ncbi:MAG: tetratricopeptide repeat protein, partial [Isosphaeraceae bacterium]|nr:tetratricopeptide repeat protein [Isosphaeraceae bacterium]
MPLRSSHTGLCRAFRTLGLLLALVAPAPAQEAPARDVPEDLNFANGLFRNRRYREAAAEYEGFLKGAAPGAFADEGRFGLASARLFQGQYAEARRQFEAFLKAAPEHANAPTAWYRVGEAAFMLGDLPAARVALETYTEKYPKHRFHETAWPYLGDVRLRLGALPEARQAYEKALADFPKGRLADRAKLGLGRALAQQGETEAALKVLDDLARTGAADWVSKAWFHMGQVRSGAGEYAQAVEAYDTLEKLAPQSSLLPEARLRRAEALLKLDRAPEAEASLRALATGDVARNVGAQAAFALGTAQLERGQAAEALATLDDALKRFENTPLAPALLFRSAEAQQKLKQTDDARARFLKASEIDPKDPWADVALLHAARLALEAGDKGAARSLATALPERFPRSALRADARLIEARVALDAGQPKEAIARLNASLAEDKPEPETAESQRYYLGLAYRADGQLEKAKELLDELAAKSDAPVAADAQLMVAQGHIDAKRFGDAVPVLKKYLSAKPPREYADYALAHLARADLELGQADEAAKALDELATRFPKSKTLPPTRLRLAEAALGAKQYDRAAELFRQVVEADAPALRARARSGLGWAL